MHAADGVNKVHLLCGTGGWLHVLAWGARNAQAHLANSNHMCTIPMAWVFQHAIWLYGVRIVSGRGAVLPILDCRLLPATTLHMVHTSHISRITKYMA